MKLNHALIPASILSILSVALVILGVLVEVPTFIRSEIVSTQLTFRTNEYVSNLLNLGRNCSEIAIEISNFSSVSFIGLETNEQDEGYEEVIEQSEDISSRVRFNSACISELNLEPDTLITLAINSGSYLDSNVSYIELSLQGLQDPISISTFEESQATFMGGKYESKQYNLPAQPITVVPEANIVRLVIRTNSSSLLTEYEPLTVSHLEFTKVINNKHRSSVLKGEWETLFNERIVVLNRNSRLSLDSRDQYQITAIEIVDSQIRVSFEGTPRNAILGEQGTNLVPKLLVYLNQNSFILLVFNSIFALSAFLIAIYRGAARNDKQENM